MQSTEVNYNPKARGVESRRRAFRVWFAVLVVVLLWTVATITAPLVLAAGYSQISSPLYHFFGYICHQKADRSFHVAGEQFAVCSRCFGVYFGLVLGAAAYPLWRRVDTIEPIARFWLFLSVFPMAIDWSLTAFGIWENTQASRVLTGAILGVACATFIIPAAVEITRNLRRPRLSQRPV